MVAITIILVLMTYSIVSFKDFRKKQEVISAVEQYYAMVELARNSAINGKLGSCSDLLGHRFKVTTNAAPPHNLILSIYPICGISFPGTPGALMGEPVNLNPIIKLSNTSSIDFQILYRGASNNLEVVNPTPLTPFNVTVSYGTLGSPDDHDYTFRVEEGGFTTEGAFN